MSFSKATYVKFPLHSRITYSILYIPVPTLHHTEKVGKVLATDVLDVHCTGWEIAGEK